MPFTFFAHQVPVVPIKRAAPDRWDGLGLVVGSIMPDLWYVTQGWVFGPGGMALWVNAHLPGQFVTHCVLAGCLLTWLVRRVVAPVVPAALPDAPPFHLHDYRLLGLGRHRWWVTAYSVALGAATHLLIDGFTHGDHFGVDLVPWLGRTWFTIGSHPVAPYKWLIDNVVLEHYTVFGALLVATELAVGVCLLLGAFTPLAALIGVLFALHINFSTWDRNAWMFEGAVEWGPLLALALMRGGRRVWGLDSRLAARYPRWPFT